MKSKQNLFIVCVMMILSCGIKVFAESKEAVKDSYKIIYKADPKKDKTEEIKLVLKQEGINKVVKIREENTNDVVDVTVGFVKNGSEEVSDVLFPEELSEVDLGEKKALLNKYYSELMGIGQEKFTINNECGGKTEIAKAAFKKYSKESNGKKGNVPEKGLIRIPEKKGSIVIICKTSNTTDAIKFSYTMNFEEILNGKKKESAGKDWLSWLEKADKQTSEENELRYEGLSQKIYDALSCEGAYKELYTNEDSYLYRKYLQLKYNKAFDERAYSEAERETIAEEAEKYLYQAVEYQKYKKNKNKKETKEIEIEKTVLLYKEGDKIFDDYFTKEQLDALRENGWQGVETIGNPVPYCENGSDSPVLFREKMVEMIAKIKPKSMKIEEVDTSLSKLLIKDKDSKKYAKYSVREFGIDNKGLLSNVTGGRYNASEYDSIEERVAILGDLTMVGRGDLLILKDGKKKTVGTGIVVGVPSDFNDENKKEAVFGKEEGKYFSEIKVVYVDAESQYVTVLSMEELCKKAENGTVVAGRFVKDKENTSAIFAKESNYYWNIEDLTPKCCGVEIGKMRESSQGDEEKYRWIPNTGEYLELSEIKVTMKSKTGVDVTRAGQKVRFAGAKDRDYELDTAGAKGNIYKNRADKFKVKLYGRGNDEGEEESVVRNANGVYEYKGEKIAEINSMGMLVEDGMAFTIAVRPESAAKAYPGDDLILKFNLVNDKGTVISGFECEEKDYVAVYDKKMLWRANLYIQEEKKEGEAVVKADWNDVHPWNVPAEGSAGGPVWWNAEDWGNNEWNRPESGYNGVKGGQVVNIPSTKWCYGYDGKSQHQINRAVAYDHQGWDNPFSFIEKIEAQRELMNQWYTENGIKFGKPVYEWTGTDYAECLGAVAGGYSGDLKELYNLYKNNKNMRWNKQLVEEDYKNLIFSKNYGDRNKVPYKNYVSNGGTFSANFIAAVTKNKGNVTGGNEDAVSINGKTYYPYVPGLSDSLMTDILCYPAKEMSKYTAGTDCNGLLQSSASYGGCYYGAMSTQDIAHPTKYFVKPAYMDTKSEDITESIMSFWTNTNCATIIGDYDDYDSQIKFSYTKEDGTIEKRPAFTYFKYVVPGDVVAYSGHVMMVDKVAEPKITEEGKLYWEDGKGVQLIESVFSNYVASIANGKGYGVIKSRNLTELKISANSAVKDYNIWRQK